MKAKTKHFVGWCMMVPVFVVVLGVVALIPPKWILGVSVAVFFLGYLAAATRLIESQDDPNQKED